VSNGDFEGYAATVLNFVAPNCGFCERQIPKVDHIRAEFEPIGVRFVNVSQQMGQKVFAPSDAAAKYSTLGSLELAIDLRNKIGAAYHAAAYPTMFVIRSDGTVAYVNIGAKGNIEDTLRQQLQALLGGPPVQPEPGPTEGGE
jgi:thiol-disulfide isomerase/thioredoxin